MKQTSLFDGAQKFVLDKPIRLIELFAGYGSQALSLKYLGANFEHWKISEWAIKSIQAYKDLHFGVDHNDYSNGMGDKELGDELERKCISSDYKKPLTRQQIDRLSTETKRKIYNNMVASHNLGSVTGVHGKDLEIVDKDKYCYVMSYSFPCQSISNIGKKEGLKKDSGTTSSLLWEVERILSELEGGGEPNILLMENVPQLLQEKNVYDFADWCKFLEKLGYKNYYKVLNTKDFGIPQNRERVFMVSIFGDYDFEFPMPICDNGLSLKEILQKNVPEKYYLKDKIVEYFVRHTEEQKSLGNGFKFEPIDVSRGGGQLAKTINTRNGSRMDDTYISTDGD